MKSELELEVYLPKERKDVAVLRLSGSLDAFSVPSLEEKIQALIRDKRCHIVVNCEKLKFLSSPGMGLFLGTLAEVEKLGGSVAFARVTQPEVYDAMDLLGFFNIFSVYPEEGAAILRSQKG